MPRGRKKWGPGTPEWDAWLDSGRVGGCMAESCHRTVGHWGRHTIRVCKVESETIERRGHIRVRWSYWIGRGGEMGCGAGLRSREEATEAALATAASLERSMHRAYQAAFGTA